MPAGAIPKDGPSAGITITTALTSLLTGRPVKHTVGMTGEVTLQGRVLPIGGLKQKVLAAHAAGLTDVVIPERNRGDLEDVPEEVREAMSFHPVEALTGAVVIPALVFLVPIHVAVLGLVLLVMTVMGVTNHMGWELFPRWLVEGPAGKWLITASHHQRHHEKYLCNFGLYFRHWDRLCGTDRGLGQFAIAPVQRRK